MSKITTRFAPSPTGFLHVGGARTALYNYLFAIQNNGEFVLRIEDTDKTRSKKEYENSIIDGLAWLGLEYSRLERQSERLGLYKQAIKKLLDSKKAYISNEQDGENSEVIRFKNPNKIVSFNDLIRGVIQIDTSDLGDFVIAKDMDTPLYHLAVVVDDIEMEITHIFRGEDGISNTPRQILLQEALGEHRRPIYAHIPLILGPERSKLSKREGGHRIEDFKNKGYMSEAILNYLALLGWTPKGGREILSIRELVDEFRIEDVHKGGALFDEMKLKFLNREYLRRYYENPKTKDFCRKIIEDKLPKEYNDVAVKLLPLIVERINVISDIDVMLREDELSYYLYSPKYEVDNLIDKKTKPKKNNLINYLGTVKNLLNEDNMSDIESIKKAVLEFASSVHEGRGAVLWAFRFALTGKDKSPDPFIVANILGKEETLKRLDTAINKLTH